MTKEEKAIVTGEKSVDFGRYDLRLNDVTEIVEACKREPEGFLFNIVTAAFAVGFSRGSRATASKN